MEKRGEKINGSRYVRAFCIRCSEPIRVTPPAQGAICDTCTKSCRCPYGELSRPVHQRKIIRQMEEE